MKLFQYWHGEPPPDVGARMAEASRQPGFDYVRHDEASARRFIARECDARTLAAWDALALPAMQADLLRMLLIARHGGVWADATVEFVRPLGEFVALSPHGQMPAIFALANTCYIMVRAPGDPYIRACVDLMLDAIEARRGRSALMAVGPGPMNAVRCVLMPEVRPLVDALASALEDWADWGWADCLAAADRVIAPTPARAAACRAIDLFVGAEFEAWAISRPAAHRSGGNHWRDHVGRIYREGGPSR